MSRENVEIVRDLIDAWNRRDVERLAALFHPEGEWLLPRNLLEGGSYRGPRAAESMLADAADMWEDVQLRIEDIRPAGERAAISLRAINVGKTGVPTVEYRVGQVVVFRDGKIIYSRPYTDFAEALEAVGLRE
jgi:ketosteroid isomerase-like protein